MLILPRKLQKLLSKLALTVLVAILIIVRLPQATIGQTQLSFSDVSGHWAQVYIEALATRGFLAGYPRDTKYYPDQPVTRAEFAAIVNKVFNPPSKRESKEFVDVPRSYWGYQAIQTAYRGGFLDGYPGNVFQPDQHIPRVQALVSLAAGIDLQPQDRNVLSFYSDADTIPDFAVNAIVATTEQQIVVNYPVLNQLHPNRETTRAEVAAFIHQALVKTGTVPPISPRPTTVVVVPPRGSPSTSGQSGSGTGQAPGTGSPSTSGQPGSGTGQAPGTGSPSTSGQPGSGTGQAPGTGSPSTSGQSGNATGQAQTTQDSGVVVANTPPTNEKPPIHLVMDSPDFVIPVDPLDVYTPNPNLTAPSERDISSSKGEYTVSEEPPPEQWQTFLFDEPSSRAAAFQPVQPTTGVTNPNINPPVPVNASTWTPEKLNVNNVPRAGNNQPGVVITGVRVDHNIPLDQYTKGMAITISSNIWNARGQAGSVNAYLKKSNGQYVSSKDPRYKVPGKEVIVSGQSIQIPSSQNNLTALKTVLYIPYSAIDLPSGRHQDLRLQAQIQMPTALANDENYQLDLSIASRQDPPAGQFFIPETNSSSPRGSLPQAEAYLINGFYGCCVPEQIHQVLIAPKGQDTGVFPTPERPGGFKGLGIPTAVGNWDDLYSERVGLTARTDNEFRRQIRTRFGQGNQTVPLILIGHSFGADSLLQVTQCEAGNNSACPPNQIPSGRKGRKVRFLGVIDGVEFGGKRTRRTVPNNVDYLFNRWTDEPSRSGAAAGGAAAGFVIGGPTGALIGAVAGGAIGIPVNSGADGRLQCEANQCQDQDKQGISRQWNGDPYTDKCGWLENCPGKVLPTFTRKGSPGEKQRRVDHGGLPNDDRVQYQMLEALTKSLTNTSFNAGGPDTGNTSPQGIAAYSPPDITLTASPRLQTCTPNCSIRVLDSGKAVIDISYDALRNSLNLPQGINVRFLSWTGLAASRGEDGVVLQYPRSGPRTVAVAKFTLLVEPTGGTRYKVERTIFVTRQN
jgi:S-layer homology domain